MLLFHLLLPLFYSAIFFFSFSSPFVYAQFVGGVFLGFCFFFFDRVLDVFFLHEETDVSKLVRDKWKQGNLIGALRLLYQYRQHQQQLLGRSIVFIAIYMVSAIFFLTSTGSSIGQGIILGMGLHYMFDFFRYIRLPDLFHDHFLWQVKRKFSQREIEVSVIGFLLFFTLITVMALFRVN
jgi:hypothetical protein